MIPIPETLTDILTAGAPEDVILRVGEMGLTRADVQAKVRLAASCLAEAGVVPGDRVVVWLPKSIDAVVCYWAAAHLGAVFVPISPVLKPNQVVHILKDSGACALVTTPERLQSASDILLTHIQNIKIITELYNKNNVLINLFKANSDDLVALLYTSGSTGMPKGVMLSHRNLCTGAASVAQYLKLTSKDRILCVLPLSFDYGLNQVISAFLVGAQAVLYEYLLPKDVLNALAQYQITGLAGVPTLWVQLAMIPDWPALPSLRYTTNSGGPMPTHTLSVLMEKLTSCQFYLMYGLTEAFRSTYLDPSLARAHPDSIGQAIPHAEVRVVDAHGQEVPCDVDGELVHMGPLVALGYWKDPERTAQRFRPAPPCAQTPGSRAVWSGDRVRRDAQGLLYFIGRDDEMIKTSGYRISPTEIEDVLYGLKTVHEAVACGVSDPILGQIIAVALSLRAGEVLTEADVVQHCRAHLPPYMVPKQIALCDALPHTPHGKLDRAGITAALRSGAWST